MTPTGRFAAATVLTLTGGALVIAASRLGWVLVETPGEPVVVAPGRTAFIGRSVVSHPGHVFVPALLPLGVLIVLSAGLTLLSSVKVRRLVLAVALGAAVASLALVIARWAPDRLSVTAPVGSVPEVRAGSARAVGIGGAIVAVTAAAAAIPAATGARPFRLPE